MSWKVRTSYFFLFCLVCSASVVEAQTHKRTTNREPTFFSPDYQENDPFAHARPPADDILAALLKTPEARENEGALAGLDREELRKLFSVVEVHLAGSEEADEVVLGHVPLSGADNDWFWIVRRQDGHTRVILFANGLSIELLNSRTLGYKNIRTLWGAASGLTITCLYHYEGKRYRLVHKYSKTVNSY
jgi:hypothetical protein